mmetsp:Transcript_100662/g.146924  ORF Transcript_100662/g.146924 Transcript_100662/m.146924 type:complete len:235 (-) Transcript_100662:811-1515(-)
MKPDHAVPFAPPVGVDAVGVDALENGVGVLACETGVRAFLPLPLLMEPCSNSPQLDCDEKRGGGVAKPEKLSTGEGSERLHCALASARATKPLRASSSMPSHSKGGANACCCTCAPPGIAGVEHIDSRLEGLGLAACMPLGLASNTWSPSGRPDEKSASSLLRTARSEMGEEQVEAWAEQASARPFKLRSSSFETLLVIALLPSPCIIRPIEVLWERAEPSPSDPLPCIPRPPG